MAEELLEILTREGLITEVEAEKVRLEQRRTGEPTKTILINLKLLTEEQIAETVARQLRIPYVELDHYIIERKALEAVTEKMARESLVIPLYQLGDTVVIAVADPFNIYAVDEIQSRRGGDVLVTVATESAIRRSIEHYYRVTDSVRDVVKSLESSRVGAPVAEVEKISEEERLAQEPPVVRLVNLIITQAIRDRASDIHIEPRKEGLCVRFRIDGILRETIKVPPKLQPPVLTRIKILAGMNIAEKRLPQDGHIEVERDGKEIDLRVATYPTTLGEKVVMRVLYRGGIRLGLSQLGFEPEMLQKFQKIVLQPYGMILSTGPTGCGKTTTLYAALDTINTPEKNILTIEDPVEYELELVNQSQVNPKAGLTFATGLRAMFRLDPDIIMVGEIRDLQSAQIAVQAALTGHLVFSSLHTNDAPSTATRLVDMGIEPYLVASTLLCSLSQRLVRVLCSECKEQYEATDYDKGILGVPLEEKVILYTARGCKHCNQTGYYGRTGIFEMMVLDETIRRLIVSKATTSAIREAAVAAGMVTLRQAGIRKALAGITSLSEVMRVIGEESAMY
ncbi:MAG: ATPase, T2SS/T4P/T4SS family [Planctomycetota bacterium]|nr:ATPase, T2SS/T4P/T4SS family [Planctomycetota bacterium]